MDIGAIAMIDALGFRGIWRRETPSEVLASLVDLQEYLIKTAQSLTSAWSKLSGPGKVGQSPRATALCLSDTIVLALSVPSFEPLDDRQTAGLQAGMANMLVHTLAFAIAAGSQGVVPLNYRGAATWGEFFVRDNFLIGPAVDEVAELHNRSDAAAVEITEKLAVKVQESQSLTIMHPELSPARLMFEHALPLKTLSSESVWVVNPYGVCRTDAERHDVLQGIKKAFGADGARLHESKLRNTMALLSEAAKAWLASVS